MAAETFALRKTEPFGTDEIKARMKIGEKLVLVLPGGGSRGRWQFGAIYRLYQIGVLDRVDLICGTSVGGLNTLFTAKYKSDMEKPLSIWNSIKKNSDVYDGIMRLRTPFDFVRLLAQIFTDNKARSILNPRGLYSLIDREFAGLKIKDLSCPVCLATTNMSTADFVEISTMSDPDFSAAQLAKLTSAIPIIFPAVEFANEGYTDLGVDGGMGRHNPVKLAIKNGATKIILIGTSPHKIPREALRKDVVSLGGRLENALMHIFEESSWDEADLYKKFSELDAVQYPPIEFLDLYPKDGTYNLEYEINALDFSGTMTMQNGYDHAVRNFSPEVIGDFLTS
jgi:predicted acylesterase/phospholipase RssA